MSTTRKDLLKEIDTLRKLLVSRDDVIADTRKQLTERSDFYREQMQNKDAEWQKRYDGVCNELSTVRTAIGRESQRWITQPCETCSRPAGLKTNLHVQCDDCFRKKHALPNVCGKEKRAEGFQGAFKCARAVGHEGLCEGVMATGLLAKEIDPAIEAKYQADVAKEMDNIPREGYKIG